MTVRVPLYFDDDSSSSTATLKQMTTSQINEIKDAFKQLYLETPSVALTVVGSGGNLGSMIDSRLISGAVSVGTSAFPAETVTQEPQIQETAIARIQQTISTDSEPANLGNIEYPVYYDIGSSGEPIIRSMTLQDMYDTFGNAVVNDLDEAGAVYTITTNTTESGYDEVSGSGTPIFTDTRANPAGYNAGEIPETEDASTTTEVTKYYLHKKRYVTPAYKQPARVTRSGNVMTPDPDKNDIWTPIFKSIIRYMVASVPGYRLRYSINGSGVQCGTTMTDTRLEGTGNYQTRQVGDDDYRAQEFPDGSSVIINTYTLNVNRE